MITGGAGFLGINLVRYLLAHGHTVRTLDFAPFDYPERTKVDAQTGDIRDRAAVDRAMQGVDIVIHTAAALPLYTVALDQLLAAPTRRIFITNATGHLHGIIDLAGVLSALTGEERAALIAALQRPQPAPLAISPGLPLDLLVARDPPTLAPDVSINHAARLLLDLSTDSMPVVDAEGRLLGIIARGGLIRALLQQSD